MKYNMTVTISDPNTEEGMDSTLILKMQAKFSYSPNRYGNGYYLAIIGDEGKFQNLYDLRYNCDFREDAKEDFLKEWAASYWTGKDGAYRLDDLKIEKTA